MLTVSFFGFLHAFCLSLAWLSVQQLYLSGLLAFMGRLHMSARAVSFVNVTLNGARAGTETHPALFSSLDCMFSKKPVLILRWWSRKTWLANSPETLLPPDPRPAAALRMETSIQEA